MKVLFNPKFPELVLYTVIAILNTLIIFHNGSMYHAQIIFREIPCVYLQGKEFREMLAKNVPFAPSYMLHLMYLVLIKSTRLECFATPLDLTAAI